MTLTTPRLTGARPAEIAGSLAGAPHEWVRRVRLDAQERWYERLRHDEDHEVWLLSWLPGQSTGLHDHGVSAGAFAVALGTLEEREPDASRILTTGHVREFGPGYVHEVRNISTAPAVSVHVYSPPLTTMGRYDLTAAGLVRLAVEEADQW